MEFASYGKLFVLHIDILTKKWYNMGNKGGTIMDQKVCSQCGAPIDAGTIECKFCGQIFEVPNVVPTGGQLVQQENFYTQQEVSEIDPNRPVRSKVTAGLLGIFLGVFGIHKFYLGQIWLGILYLAFCWTYIPGFVGFIEGIIYLCTNDEKFQEKYHVRLK